MNLQRQYEDDFAMTQQFAIITFMNRVYAWMTVGLLVTGVVAFGINAMQVAVNPMMLLISGLGSLGLVFFLSFSAPRLPAAVAIGGYLLFAVLEGIFFSLIFVVYPMATISMTFFITAGLFGFMAIFGTVTKKDLSGVGALCFMGLIGIILAIVVQMIVGSVFGIPTGQFNLLISIVGVVVFIGLTAYDAQKIKQMSLAGETSTGLAIAGALALYLDFVNLFLFLLRIFGSRD